MEAIVASDNTTVEVQTSCQLMTVSLVIFLGEEVKTLESASTDFRRMKTSKQDKAFDTERLLDK